MNYAIFNLRRLIFTKSPHFLNKTYDHSRATMYCWNARIFFHPSKNVAIQNEKLICNFIGKLLLHFLTNCHINYKTLETVATCMMYFILRWILKCCFVVEIRPRRAVWCIHPPEVGLHVGWTRDQRHTGVLFSLG